MKTEKRFLQRYPCVGITLMYSPLSDQNFKNVAEYLYNATSNDISLNGLSFDTYQELSPGDKLVLLIRIPEQNASERLLTEVSWCKQISGEKFRIGVKIDTSTVISHDSPGNDIHFPVNADSVPAEAELRCPACMEVCTFSFVDNQMVPDKGIIPLYNCSNCGSTRSLIGILANSRSISK